LHLYDVDKRWALVHATHATPAEIQETAARGATIVVCPSTEANLGDGIFDLARWHAAGARIAVGSDSHITLDPAAELSMLEYGARLRDQRRIISEAGPRWRAAARAGSAAAGIAGGEIARGMPAHLLEIDMKHPLMAGKSPDQMLAAYIFSRHASAVRTVWRSGRAVVVDGQHGLAGSTGTAFSYLLNRVGPVLFGAKS
jgi:formimidoylglutamate deiminase